MDGAILGIGELAAFFRALHPPPPLRVRPAAIPRRREAHRLLHEIGKGLGKAGRQRGEIVGKLGAKLPTTNRAPEGAAHLEQPLREADVDDCRADGAHDFQ